MDWRDFMKGFFGGRAPAPHSNGSEQRDVWPPPPPIPEFQTEENQTNQPQTPTTGEVPFWGRRSHREPNGNNDGFEDFGNRFVFGDLFSTMGEMFKEMERSMRDMESFFGDMRIEDHTKMIPFSGPPAIQDSTQPDSKDDSIRDFVLKESERDNRQNSRHYIPAPDNASEKVDRDLDDLHQSNMLDLSDLPLPNTSQDSQLHGDGEQHGSLTPFNFGRPRGGAATFQKTYQTFSFKNGRWEGEIVKEDQNGKEVTRYFQDKEGQRHETTEYFPKAGSSSIQRPTITDSSDITPLYEPEPTRLFQFFDKFFKPRM